MWSFGIVLYEIMKLGGDPYPGIDNSEVLPQILQGYRLEIPPNCPQSLYELMLEVCSGK